MKFLYVDESGGHDLFERRDLLELLRGDPPGPRISPNQSALLSS